jgi:type IV pilus assembly protein PilC
MFYRYEAVDRAGKTVMGTMDAPSESAVSARLSQMGYRARRVMPAASAAPPRGGSAPTAKTAAVPSGSRLAPAKAKEYALFFRQLAALARSGISLFDALDGLHQRTLQPALKQTAKEMADAARTGGQISDVMARHPALYPAHVVSSVRAGETGGFVDIVVDELALEYEQQIAFYKGAWLPKTLVVQGILAIAIAQPFFTALFGVNKKGGGDITVGEQMREFLLVLLTRNLPIALGLLLLLRLGWLWLMKPEQAERRDRLALKVPVFGDLARQRSLAAFIRMLRRLFAAGVGPVSAWHGAMSVAPNSVIRARLEEAYARMQKNEPLHQAFISTGLFANETEQLLATGVISGQMTEMLDRVADYYQNNVDRAFQSSRYWMFRLGFILTIVLTGILMIVLVKTYFGGIFAFVDNQFGEP